MKLLFASLCILLSGCAAYIPTAKAPACSDRSCAVLYRTMKEPMWDTINFDVYLDDKKVGVIPRASQLALPLPEGKQTIRVKSPDGADFKDIEGGGGPIYIHVQLRPEMWVAIPVLEPVSEKIGQSESYGLRSVQLLP